MTEVTCKRCGTSAPSLPRAPLPGEPGERVLAGTCAGCWQSWLGEQVKWINELQLSPVNPEHYRLLVGKMDEYLRLSGGGAGGVVDV